MINVMLLYITTFLPLVKFLPVSLMVVKFLPVSLMDTQFQNLKFQRVYVGSARREVPRTCSVEKVEEEATSEGSGRGGKY